MKKGFSTIELMIAMVILLTAISAIMLTSGGSQNFLIGGQTNGEALSKAKEILEKAQADSRRDFRSVNPKTTDTDGYYTWWTDVGSSSNINDYFTKLVTSHVEWTDASTITRSVKLSTLVSNFENAIGGDTCNSYLTGDWTSPQITPKLFSSLITNDTTGLYQITDLDAYSTATQKRLYVSVNNSSGATTVGPKSPATATSKTGVGSTVWTSTSGALASGGSLSSASLSSGGTSNYLWLSGFGSSLNIPNGATILGIQVSLTRSASGSSSITDNQVRLIKKDGVTLSSQDKADLVTKWNTGLSTISYGNVSDLWGESWTASDINNSNFGIAFSAKNTSTSSRTANVDYISITVTYVKQFYALDTTIPTSPVLTGEIANNPMTPAVGVGVNALVVDNHYAYLAMNAVAGGQLQILNITTTPYTVLKTYSVPGVTGTTGVGQSIAYKDGYIYLGLATPGSGAGPEFHIIDVHNPSTPTEIGFWPTSGNLGNSINSLKVRGQYVYLATPNAQEIKVLNISNPSIPALVGSFDAPDSLGNGKGLDLVGNSLYLGRTVTASNPEFYIVNIEDQNNIPVAPINTKEISSSVNALYIRDYLAFLLTGTSTTQGQLQILNMNSPSGITNFVSPISLPNTPTGVSAESIDCEGNYIYVGSVPSSAPSANKGSITIVTGL